MTDYKTITREKALREEIRNFSCAHDSIYHDRELTREYKAMQSELLNMSPEERKLPEYSFIGNVIKLNYKHYNDWFSQVSDFMNEPTFLRELGKIDDWMSADESRKDNWFYRVPKMLQKKREQASF